MPITHNAVRQYRKRRGWSLRDMSGLTGVSFQYLSLVERHLREPSPAMKVQIARGTGASVAELFPPTQREVMSA
jgi:transcriptional regulator with XRE-family HTH domain